MALKQRHKTHLDEMATNDKKMSKIPTGTWPSPQYVKQPYLKITTGTYITHPLPLPNLRGPSLHKG